MHDDSTVRMARRGGVAFVTLSRPDKHNAFDPSMIASITAAFAGLTEDRGIRAVVLQGDGPSFCAGADLQWMADSLSFAADENVADARRLGAMLESVAECACPVIARVHGVALGGGGGLVAACDIAIAASDATFGFTEARLGLAPAVIAPFVVSKVGASRARPLFLTAERFSAAHALAIGLVHRVVPVEELDAAVNDALAKILANGPYAERAIKQLVTYVEHRDSAASAAYTASVIADLRVSSEGQEGIRAFLERRTPGWSAGLDDVEQVSEA